jgi:hypothetical protein
MPDFSWIARVCGAFSLVWIVLRALLAIRALRKVQFTAQAAIAIDDRIDAAQSKDSHLPSMEEASHVRNHHHG